MTAVMWVLLAEWLATALGAVAFLGLFGAPWRQTDRQVAWHLWSMGVLAAVEGISLAAVLLGWRVPAWAFAAIYGAGVAITYWRVLLVLLPRLRRR